MQVAIDYHPSDRDRLLDMMESLFKNKLLNLHCFNCGTRYIRTHNAENWRICPNCGRSIAP